MSRAVARDVGPERSGRGGADLSRDEIVRALENEIVSGTLAPGDRIDERALAARFGVSRTPVRDAIGRLASLGLIEVKPRSGSYVAEMSLDELLQLFEVMANLEGLCARYAAERMDAAEQAELRRCAEACLEQDTVEAYAVANFALHNVIYRGAKNAYLETLTRQARHRVGGYRNYTFRLPGRLRRSAEEHVEIVDAICAGDAERAHALMFKHADIKRSDFAPFVAAIGQRSRRMS
ncbi:MAG: GntR family transcriptional regulator [Acidobacteria bacterium]|nr:GntR family transcriptional regulator [Acidobacteriota bacterium]